MIIKKVTETKNKLPDTSGSVTKANFNEKTTNIESKISNTNGLVTETNFNAKVPEIENKVLRVANFLKDKFRHKRHI